MKKRFQATIHAVLASTFLCLAQTAFAQGTAFTYQGRLNTGTIPANGRYDFRFAIYNAASLGGQQGGFLTNSSTVVKDGLFTVTLDFGAGLFSGEDRWLEIGVRTNGSGAFATMAPRQPLTPAPYAVAATTASNLLGILPAQQLGGKVANSQLASNSISILAGAGLSGGGTVPLGGSVVVQNTGLLGINGSPDITATTLNGVTTLADTATSSNMANMKVRRDAGGSFSASSLTLSSNLFLPVSGVGSGIIYSGGSPFVYSSGNGSANFFAGYGAGNLTMSGNFNTGVGYAALDANTTGGNNTAHGYGALGANSSGSENVAGGVNALNLNQTGSQNVAIGAAAILRSTAGSANTAVGYETLFMNSSGSNNTATGYKALFNNTTGQGNIALGYMAGSSLISGSSNIDIGHPGLATDTNIIRIGQGQSQTYIAGTINGDAGGLTNLNAASLSGLVPGNRIDDGGSAAYQDFLGAARAMSSAEPLPFGILQPITGAAGAPPELSFALDGSSIGTVAGFVGREGLSKLYEFVVEVVVPKGELVASAQLGRSGVLTFVRNGRSTTFAGVVTACSAAADDGVNRLYTFRLEPPLAYMAFTSDYRVNQAIAIPDLLSSLYSTVTSNSITSALSGSYAPRESVIQFGETDLNFFNRLLEDEGIFYCFNQGGKLPGLVLGDGVSSYRAAPNSPFNYYGGSATGIPQGAEYVRTFHKSARQFAGSSALDNYDFTRPKTELLVKSQIAPGRGELYEYGSSVTDIATLQQMARNREDGQAMEGVVSIGTGNAPDLRPGYTFTLSDQAGSGLGGSYLVTAVRHGAFRRLTNGVASFYYGNEFEVIPSTALYRPARITPKPQAQACTAVVTGPAGEEIYVDKYGRVKVQFHWDRYGTGDNNSSGWIRVASQWAGKQFGMVFNPRVGQEVLVQFVQGDPDRPVITGSFYNGENMPPYALPSNQTQSGIKTRSTKAGTADNFNEIRLEDKKGFELFFLHAEKDMAIEVEHDLSLWAGHDSVSRIDHDMSLSVGGNIAITSGNNLTLSSSLGVGINTANDPAFGLKVGGIIKADAFQGDGTGLTALPANVAYLNSSQTFTASTTFGGTVSLNGLILAFADGFMNDHDLHLRNDMFHGIGWYGGGRTFAGSAVDGPVVYGFSGGALGSRSFTGTNIALAWTASGSVGIGTNTPSAMLDVAGDERIRGTLRSGSETGTAEAPNPAGLIVRRVNSTSAVSNLVVAVARTSSGIGNISLVRDGTAGGFQIQYPASPGTLTIACMGIDGSGVSRNFYTTIPSASGAGTVQIYPPSAGVVHFECTFGNTYNAGQHLTQVTLSRYGTDSYWSGTLTSTYNQ